MDSSNLPNDDFQDVVDMTNKIRKVVDKLFSENDPRLCLSALFTVTINSILVYAETYDSIALYKQAFVTIMEENIKEFQD